MAVDITDEELEIFHFNLDFMWKKLSTNHYHVKQDSSSMRKLKIIGADDLPAYSTLSKCSNDKSYRPPRSVIDKIVLFYNQNITPETNTYQFLHERLDLNPELRKKINVNILDKRFLGTYFCYYPSPDNSELILGGMMKIFETPGMIRAAYIPGIRNDSALNNKSLKYVFDETPSLKKFNSYHKSLNKDECRCSYYEGTVEISQRSLLIHYYEQRGALRKMTFTLNIRHVPPTVESYDGGIGYMLCTSDGSYDTRFFKIGIMRCSDGYLSLEDDRVKTALEFKAIDSRKVVTLVPSIDRAWFDLILSSMRET